jgi:glycosyltransferase involved in cell wall biosynthesis
MDKPWLSVVIPCRNGQRWLADTLQSIVDQREERLEVILVDGSTDNASLDIAESFSGKLDIRVFRRPDLDSWMAKTNFAVEQAGADRICMLHTDDLWLPNRCEELRKWLSSQPDAVMHLHPCYFIDENGRRLGVWRCPLPPGDSPVPARLLYERLLFQNFVGIPSPTIRRADYLTVGGLDDALWYTADWDLYLKLAALGDIHYHRDPLACFRVHNNSLTVLGSRDPIDFRNQHQIIFDRHSNSVIPEIRDKIQPIFKVSVDVNVASAEAMNGKYAAMIKVVYSILSLGPVGMIQYFSCSRIVDRLVPRLRALAAAILI